MGCAIFRRRHNGFLLADASLTDVPARVDANHEAVLALLAHRKAQILRDRASLQAAVALPMSHRNELYGFILIGARPDGEPYRPDQIHALELAAREVGLDFHALDLDILEREIASERRASQMLRAQLDTAMTLAKTNLMEGSS